MLVNVTEASEALGFSSRTSLQRLIKAGHLAAYVRGKRGRAVMLETEPVGLPPLRDAVRGLTVARVGSPLWAKTPSKAEAYAAAWDELAQIANEMLDLRQWSAPPWSGQQWASLAGVAELARLEVQFPGD